MTDALSYKAVSIPNYRIYSISPSGEVKMDFFSGYKSSYIKLTDLVDHIFPPITIKINSIKHANEDFKDYNYWREPVGIIELDKTKTDTPAASSILILKTPMSATVQTDKELVHMHSHNKSLTVAEHNSGKRVVEAQKPGTS
jgi:phosphatidate phosphatase LPIN